MIVCYFGTYRADYSRNRIMIEGLRQNGVEVIECHQTLWRGVEDRVAVTKGGWFRPAFWWRVVSTYARLIWQYRKVKDFDVMVVGYPGQFDVFLARLLTWLKRRPLVWDILMSVVLTAEDRGLGEKNSLTLKMMKSIERWACKLPHHLIMDTRTYADWFSGTYGVPPEKFTIIPLGADDRIFTPSAPLPASPAQPLRAIYYGTFTPNHDVPLMIEAAAKLPQENFIFEFIGEGSEKAKSIALACEKGLQNAIFLDWLPQSELLDHLHQADVILVSFGNAAQAHLSIHNKVYESLALQKTALSGESPALAEFFQSGVHLLTCRRNDLDDMVRAMQTLQSNPALRLNIARNGHALFVDQFSLARTGAKARDYLQSLLKG